MGKEKKHSSSFIDMQFVTSTISTMLVLLLLGLVVFFVLSANNLSIYVKENISFSLLISDDMHESAILQYQKKLNDEPFVKATTYISKKQALKEQTEAMGTDPKEFLGYNPFTASIEIKLNSDYANSDSIAKIEKKLKKNSNILEVKYPQELMDAVNDNIKKISIVLLSLAGLLTEYSENQLDEKYMMVQSGGSHMKVFLKDIVYAEVYNRKVIIHTRDTNIEYYGKLQELSEIAGADFFRTHRAYLVHFKYVQKYDANCVTMENGTALIAKQNYSEFVKQYLKYNQRKGKEIG